MPVFEFERGGKVFEVEAPDAERAKSAFMGQASASGSDLAAPSWLVDRDAAQRDRIGETFAPSEGMPEGDAKAVQFQAAVRGMAQHAQDDARDFRSIREMPGEVRNRALIAARAVPIAGALVNAAHPVDEAEQTYRNRNPGATSALEFAGPMAATAGLGATGFGARLLGLTGGGIPSRMATAAATGAGIYGGDAAMRGGDRGDVLLSGLTGGLTTSLGAGVGSIVGRIARRRAEKAAIAATPTTAQLSRQAGNLYDAAENAGVTVNPLSYARWAGGLERRLKDAGFNEGLHPAIARVLRAAEDAGVDTVGIRELDQLRRQFRSAGRDATNPDQGRLASQMVDDIDGYIAGLGTRDVLGPGDPKQAARMIVQARDLWSRSRKGELIESAFERAQNSNQPFGPALVNEFRGLTRSPKFKTFTPEERRAIVAVIRGNITQKVLRALGQLSPEVSAIRTVAGAAMGFGAGGPITAAGVPLAATVANRAATANTRHAAEMVGAQVRNGGRLPLPQGGLVTGRAPGAVAQALLAPLPMATRFGDAFDD